jgi:NAD(P)-dependent dehydrogenase (short-subunit alcohol dehydrogenase family)
VAEQREGVGLGRRLDGKSNIVTGAGSGFGRAASIRFGEKARGDLHRRRRGGRRGNRSAGRPRWRRGQPLRADITSQADCEETARVAFERHGMIDGVYANAGLEGAGSAEERSEEHWRHVIDVDLTPAWLSARAVLATMRAQRAQSHRPHGQRCASSVDGGLTAAV